MIAFEVPGEPASKSRARFTKRGSKVHAFTPEKTKQAEAQVAACYLAETKRTNGDDFRTAFAVEAEFYLARNQRRDIDNMIKLVLDGLNKVAWADDAQVLEVTGRKIYGATKGRTIVVIRNVGVFPRSEGSCKRCGKIYPQPPSHWAKKHCSDACRRADARENRAKTCSHCGETFTHARPKSEQRYCSKECAYKAKHVDVVCANCSQAFTKARSLNRSGNAYCSPECKATYWRTHRKTAAQGTCDDCGGPTSKKAYKRCRDCQYAAGGRWAYQDGAA